TSPAAICTLSLHDALPISLRPGRSSGPMANSVGSRLPLPCPSSRPLHHTLKQESTPSKRSTEGPAGQSAGNTNSRRYSPVGFSRSEEHTSELQSPYDLVCR